MHMPLVLVRGGGERVGPELAIRMSIGRRRPMQSHAQCPEAFLRGFFCVWSGDALGLRREASGGAASNMAGSTRSVGALLVASLAPSSAGVGARAPGTAPPHSCRPPWRLWVGLAATGCGSAQAEGRASGSACACASTPAPADIPASAPAAAEASAPAAAATPTPAATPVVAPIPALAPAFASALAARLATLYAALACRSSASAGDRTDETGGTDRAGEIDETGKGAERGAADGTG